MNKRQIFLVVVWATLTICGGLNIAHYLLSDGTIGYLISLRDEDSASHAEVIVILWTAASGVTVAVFPFCGPRRMV